MASYEYIVTINNKSDNEFTTHIPFFTNISYIHVDKILQLQDILYIYLDITNSANILNRNNNFSKKLPLLTEKVNKFVFFITKDVKIELIPNKYMNKKYIFAIYHTPNTFKWIRGEQQISDSKINDFRSRGRSRSPIRNNKYTISKVYDNDLKRYRSRSRSRDYDNYLKGYRSRSRSRDYDNYLKRGRSRSPDKKRYREPSRSRSYDRKKKTFSEPDPVNYGQPPVNYGQPPVNYGQLPVNYGQPPVNYGQPPVNYGQPPVNYGQPPVNYGQPQVHYEQPPVHYGQPPVNYVPLPPPIPVKEPVVVKEQVVVKEPVVVKEYDLKKDESINKDTSKENESFNKLRERLLFKKQKREETVNKPFTTFMVPDEQKVTTPFEKSSSENLLNSQFPFSEQTMFNQQLLSLINQGGPSLSFTPFSYPYFGLNKFSEK